VSIFIGGILLSILIPEDIPSSNKGEAALFEGIYSSLELFGDFELSIFSVNPDEDTTAYAGRARVIDGRGIIPKHMLDGSGSIVSKAGNYFNFMFLMTLFIACWYLFRRRLLMIFKGEIWRSFSSSDIVLMCHDSFYAPLYHGPLILAFRALGKPVVLYGSTILPPNRKKSGWWAKLRDALNRFFLRRAQLVSVRELMSYNYLKDLGIELDRCVLKVHPDFAFLGKAAPKDEVLSIMREEGIPEDTTIVGMAISQRELSYAYPSVFDEAERIERALSAMVKVVNHITDKLGATIIFVPHSIGPTERVDDRVSAEWILQRAKKKDRIINIKNNYTAMQLKGLAGRCRMTIGSRLHFTIDAISMRVPSILITHVGEFRCHGIIGDMAGQKDYVYNIDEVRGRELIALVDQMWTNHLSIRSDLDHRLPAIEQDTRQHAISAKKIFDQNGN
jgi:polysaccharide pyruvyl transferase WcaK-like protein